MTSQTLPTINTDVNFEQIASIIGQDEPKATNTGDSLAFLRINYNTEDDNEKTVSLLATGLSLHLNMVLYSLKK